MSNSEDEDELNFEDNDSDDSNRLPSVQKRQKSEESFRDSDQEKQEEDNEDFDENEDDFLELLQNEERENEIKKREQYIQQFSIIDSQQGPIETITQAQVLEQLVQERRTIGRSAGIKKASQASNEQEYLQLIYEKKERQEELAKLMLMRKAKKIRSNPEEFRDLVKCFVLCDIGSTCYFLKQHLEDDMLCGLILSRFSLKTLDFLTSMKRNPSYTFHSILRTACFHIQQIFIYEWANENRSLEENIKRVDTEGFSAVGYYQMQLILCILLRHIGIHFRIAKVIDMRYLKLDAKYNMKSKKSSVPSQKRSSNPVSSTQSRDSLITKMYTQKKAARFSDMSSRISQNLMKDMFNYLGPPHKENDEEEELKSDASSIAEDTSNVEENNFDSFINAFKFNKKQTEQTLILPVKPTGINKQILKKEEEVKNTQFTESEENNCSSKSDELQEIEGKQEMDILFHQNINPVFGEDSKGDFDPKSFMFSKQDANLWKKQSENSQSMNSKNLKDSDEQSIKFKSNRTNIKNDLASISDAKFWIEGYDERENCWVRFDAVFNTILQKEDIDQKMNGMPLLFALTYGFLELEKPEFNKSVAKNRPTGNLFVFDNTDLIADRYIKAQLSRKELGIDYWWKKLLQIISFENHLELLDPDYRKEVQIERELKKTIGKSQIPLSFSEFKISEYYVLKSQLKKYQGMKPNAKKTNISFKDEEVFYKEDIAELHSRTRWRTNRRQVRKGEKCLKEVTSLFAGEKMVQLFGEWQTDELVHMIAEDGSLPRNDYGNWEIFSGEPPAGTVLIQLPGLAKLLKKENIEFVEAVSGFENSASGRPHIVKQGVLAHSKDEERIRQIYTENHAQMVAQQVINLRKSLLQMWRKVFQGILLKKSISERLHKIDM